MTENFVEADDGLDDLDQVWKALASRIYIALYIGAFSI